MNLTQAQIRSFRARVLNYYRKHGRKLPWRETKNPYHILVAEFMLQQTQVQRVIPHYLAFIQTLPTIQSLADAPVREVLSLWSGLGYNSRAIRLQATAQLVVRNYGGIVPSDPEILQTLPGIGFYTSGAISAFAYNRRSLFYDTNIRRVLIAGLNLPEDTGKEQLLQILAKVSPKRDPNEWYNALMDYGATKLTAAKTNIPSLTKQSVFAGSDREVRGRVMKILLRKSRLSLIELTSLFPHKESLMIVKKMIEDGLPLTISRGIIKLVSETEA